MKKILTLALSLFAFNANASNLETKLNKAISQVEWNNFYTYEQTKHKNQFKCLVMALYHETRGDKEGALSIASNIRNRTWNQKYPDNYCQVITQTNKKKKAQYQWVKNKSVKELIPTDYNSLEFLSKIAYIVINDNDSYDPTNGSTHFMTENIKVVWAKDPIYETIIGKHRHLIPRNS